MGLRKESSEWLSDTTPPDRRYPLDRCIQKGLGAAYRGIYVEGHWSIEEANSHIDVLELRAATLALRALLRHLQPVPKHVHLRVDNTTAVAYINNRGRTRSPALTSQA